MTLGCLAPYRRLGIGTKMLEHVLSIVKEDGNYSSIFLHVQVNNESAIEFYKKFGFNIVETKEQYYKVSGMLLYNWPSPHLTVLLEIMTIRPNFIHHMASSLVDIFLLKSWFFAENRTGGRSRLGEVLEAIRH